MSPPERRDEAAALKLMPFLRRTAVSSRQATHARAAHPPSAQAYLRVGAAAPTVARLVVHADTQRRHTISKTGVAGVFARVRAPALRVLRAQRLRVAV